MAAPLKAPDPIPALFCSLGLFLSFLDFHFHFSSHLCRGRMQRKASRGQEHWSQLRRQMNIWGFATDVCDFEQNAETLLLAIDALICPLGGSPMAGIHELRQCLCWEDAKNKTLPGS
jgi:hypothetical protein